MSESPSPPALSGPLQPPPAPPPIRRKLAAACRGRAMMLTMSAAGVLHVPAAPGHTRLHALAESALLDAGLAALREVLGVPAPAPAIHSDRRDLAPLEATQARLERLEDMVRQHCARAGFPAPEVVTPLTLGLLRRVAAHLHGHLRQAGGIKAWEREMRPVIRAAREVATWLAGPAGAPMRAALPQRIEQVLPWQLHAPAAHHADRPLGDLLPGLLERFAAGLEAQLAEAPRPTGRPVTFEPLVFGAEGLLGIWRTHHPCPPSLRAKTDGFLGWGEPLLRLAVQANDAGDGMGQAGSDVLAPGTLRRVLTEMVQAHREAALAPMSAGQPLRPGWNPQGASDESLWSDVPAMTAGGAAPEPALLREGHLSR